MVKIAVAAGAVIVLFLGLLVSVAMVAEHSAQTCGPGPAVGGSVTGTIRVVQANLPSKSGYRTTGAAGMRKIVAAAPDIVTLNEQQHRSVASLTAAAPGYAIYRDDSPDAQDAEAQAKDTAVAWKSSEWQKVDGGRERLITRKKENKGHTRSRYATWVVLKSTSDPTSQIVVISAHMPINPRMTGQSASYSVGMDNLVALAESKQAYGPVIIGGDMNYHDRQHAPWGATTKLKAAGFSFATAGEGIDYVFYPAGGTAATARGIAAGSSSDHKDFTSVTIALNGAGAADGDSVVNAGAFIASSADPAAVDANLKGLGLDSEMIQNARLIAGLANSKGGKSMAVIAVMTAYTESTLHNLSGGDRDSIGLFQQRPSQSWGTPDQIRSPTYATTKFLNSLAAIDWQQMDPWTAAQAVQRSGTPDGSNYKANYRLAEQIVDAIGSISVDDAAACASVDAAGTTIGTGKGQFTPNNAVVPGLKFTVAELDQRAQGYASGSSRSPYNDPRGISTAVDYATGRCQHFTANLLGYASSGDPTGDGGTAIGHFHWYLAHGMGHAAGTPAGDSPPIGAQLYWRTSNSAGHVTVYLGNNRMISTDIAPDGSYSPGHISIVDVASFSWGPYLGWGPASFTYRPTVMSA